MAEKKAEGEIVLPTKKDFEEFKKRCLSDEGWTEVINKPERKVWTQKTDASDIYAIRCKVLFTDVTAEVLYDVLQDHDYRKTWDEKMIEGYVIEMLKKNVEVGYYSVKIGWPIWNRDWCNMRCWSANPKKGEWVIFNRSVIHKDCPPKSDCVRAWSHLTGSFIRKVDKGIEYIYYSQSDPRGSLPTWLVNSIGTKIAPNFLDKIHTVSLAYNDWKAKSDKPKHKPWLDIDESEGEDEDKESSKKKKKSKKEKEDKNEKSASESAGEGDKDKESTKKKKKSKKSDDKEEKSE